MYLVQYWINDLCGSAHCVWYHPWAGNPGLYKKASLESHEKQASKYLSYTAPFSVTMEFLPCFHSVVNRTHLPNKFFLQVSFGLGVYHAIERKPD